MFKLYKIWYNSGNWDGIQKRYYIAETEEEVKNNCEFYKKHQYDRGDLSIREASFESYFEDPAPIENLYDYNLTVNVTKEKELDL